MALLGAFSGHCESLRRFVASLSSSVSRLLQLRAELEERLGSALGPALGSRDWALAELWLPAACWSQPKHEILWRC